MGEHVPAEICASAHAAVAAWRSANRLGLPSLSGRSGRNDLSSPLQAVEIAPLACLHEPRVGNADTRCASPSGGCARSRP